MQRDKFLFISHAEKDNEFVICFVDLLYAIGLKRENIFCSSLPEIGVPIGEDIYDYLRNLLDLDSVIPVFMLSDNYYDSVACLNEMGSVWMKQNDNYLTFLLPGFEFKKIKGAINPDKRGIKFDNSETVLRSDLTRFKDLMCEIFGASISNAQWERQLTKFLTEIKRIVPGIIVDINCCEGYCIGESFHDGCKVTIDKAKSRIVADIDFSMTNAKICSIVFSVNKDGHLLFEADKSLKFRLKTTGDVRRVAVEPHLDFNNNPKYIITPEVYWQEYKIPLQEFRSNSENWKNIKEIAFLTDERSATKCTIEIDSIRIE